MCVWVDIRSYRSYKRGSLLVMACTALQLEITFSLSLFTHTHSHTHSYTCTRRHTKHRLIYLWSTDTIGVTNIDNKKQRKWHFSDVSE